MCLSRQQHPLYTLLLYPTLCYAVTNSVRHTTATACHRFEIIFPTAKEVDEFGENWRDDIRTLLAYGESDGQLLGRAAAPIDPKLSRGRRENRFVHSIE